MRTPTTREEAERLTYGPSYAPVRFKPARCCAAVDPGRWMSTRQCFHPPGHGPGGLYCAKHNPVARAKREEKRSAQMAREHALFTATTALSSARLRVSDLAVDAVQGAGTWVAVRRAAEAVIQAQDELRRLHSQKDTPA